MSNLPSSSSSAITSIPSKAIWWGSNGSLVKLILLDSQPSSLIFIKSDLNLQLLIEPIDLSDLVILFFGNLTFPKETSIPSV